VNLEQDVGSAGELESTHCDLEICLHFTNNPKIQDDVFNCLLQ